jgi:hypothetical protein
MTEILIYLFSILIFLYLVFAFVNVYTGSNKFEGLENAMGSGTGSSSELISVTGVGSTSQLYSQSLTTAISSMETELGIDTHSQQYLTILSNLQTLYKQRALKTALQTPTQNDNTNNLMPLYLYGQNIATLETLEDFIKSRNKSKW